MFINSGKVYEIYGLLTFINIYLECSIATLCSMFICYNRNLSGVIQYVHVENVDCVFSSSGKNVGNSDIQTSISKMHTQLGIKMRDYLLYYSVKEI